VPASQVAIAPARKIAISPGVGTEPTRESYISRVRACVPSVSCR
jgi:hypothetical protein